MGTLIGGMGERNAGGRCGIERLWRSCGFGGFRGVLEKTMLQDRRRGASGGRPDLYPSRNRRFRSVQTDSGAGVWMLSGSSTPAISLAGGAVREFRASSRRTLPQSAGRGPGGEAARPCGRPCPGCRLCAGGRRSTSPCQRLLTLMRARARGLRKRREIEGAPLRFRRRVRRADSVDLVGFWKNGCLRIDGEARAGADRTFTPREIGAFGASRRIPAPGFGCCPDLRRRLFRWRVEPSGSSGHRAEGPSNSPQAEARAAKPQGHAVGPVRAAGYASGAGGPPPPVSVC